MHEASLINDMLRVADSSLAGHSVKKVTAIKIKVGPLSGAFPEALLFAFDTLKAGIYGKAVLNISKSGALARCADCGNEFDPLVSSFRCPACGKSSCDIIGGEDLVIDSIEYEELDKCQK